MSNITFNKSDELYNLILGALIALLSEQHIGKVARKVASENIFLGKWLKRAKKQKRYPKALSKDIDSLLYLYATEGRSGSLPSLFKQMYCEFQLLRNIKINVNETEMQRFYNTMTLLEQDGWFLSLPITAELDAKTPYRPSHEKEIFTTPWYICDAFDKHGNLTKPFSIFTVSPPQQVIDSLYHNGFILVKGLSSADELGNAYQQFTLFPQNKCCGDAAIPSEYLTWPTH